MLEENVVIEPGVGAPASVAYSLDFLYSVRRFSDPRSSLSSLYVLQMVCLSALPHLMTA